MIAAVLAFGTVLAIGAACRPRPRRRHVGVAARMARVPRRRGGARLLALRRDVARPNDWAMWCDSLARAVRGGATLTHALRTTAPPTPVLRHVEPIQLALERGTPGIRAVDELVIPPGGDADVVAVVLRACVEHGGPSAEPIDRAAAALRQRAALAAERRTQAAQARASAIVMTALPPVLLAMLTATSASVRDAVVSAPGVVAVTLGSALNLVGWRWMGKIVDGRRDVRRRPARSRRASRQRHRAEIDALPDLVELVVVAARVGATPVSALRSAAGLAPAVLRPPLEEVIHRLDRGVRLADALGAITERLGPSAAGFVDGLATADRYGLPLGPVLDQLADDIRSERRRALERDARTLPVRLAFPLVTCTLPAFVLTSIVPALLGAVATIRHRSI